MSEAAAGCNGTERPDRPERPERIERPCWLCQYGSKNNPHTKEILDFISESATAMSEEEIVRQVHRTIRAEWPDLDVTKEDIRRHITQHTLCSNVVLSRTLRDLNRLSEEIRDTVVVYDPETGHRSVDEKTAKLYLSCVGQITNMLKLERGNKYT